MQNLRDKLLKAGMVDKKAKKKADHKARLERTQKKRKGVREEQLQAERDKKNAAAQEQKRQADRQREKDRARAEQEALEKQKAAEQEAHDKTRAEENKLIAQYRLRELIRERMFLPDKPGPVSFNFVSRSGTIRSLALSQSLATDLEKGQLAIAQLPGRERWGLVQRDAALQALEQEPGLIRFFADGEHERLTSQQEQAAQKTPSATQKIRSSSYSGSSRNDRRDR